jgi:ribonucleotide reductase alpha subunit
MLSQMQRLSFETEGRYASDEELRFIPEFLKTYELRVQTYQKLQTIESTVIQQVHEKMKAKDPTCFQIGNRDLTAKCKRDGQLTWRASSAALLIDDHETLRERLLLWYQTISKAVNSQSACGSAYVVMQEVIQQHLTPQQTALFAPILDMSRSLLGG